MKRIKILVSVSIILTLTVGSVYSQEITTDTAPVEKITLGQSSQSVNFFNKDEQKGRIYPAILVGRGWVSTAIRKVSDILRRGTTSGLSIRGIHLGKPVSPQPVRLKLPNVMPNIERKTLPKDSQITMRNTAIEHFVDTLSIALIDVDKINSEIHQIGDEPVYEISLEYEGNDARFYKITAQASYTVEVDNNGEIVNFEAHSTTLHGALGKFLPGNENGVLFDMVYHDSVISLDLHISRNLTYTLSYTSTGTQINRKEFIGATSTRENIFYSKNYNPDMFDPIKGYEMCKAIDAVINDIAGKVNNEGVIKVSSIVMVRGLYAVTAMIDSNSGTIPIDNTRGLTFMFNVTYGPQKMYVHPTRVVNEAGLYLDWKAFLCFRQTYPDAEISLTNWRDEGANDEILFDFLLNDGNIVTVHTDIQTGESRFSSEILKEVEYEAIRDFTKRVKKANYSSDPIRIERLEEIDGTYYVDLISGQYRDGYKVQDGSWDPFPPVIEGSYKIQLIHGTIAIREINYLCGNERYVVNLDYNNDGSLVGCVTEGEKPGGYAPAGNQYVMEHYRKEATKIDVDGIIRVEITEGTIFGDYGQLLGSYSTDSRYNEFGILEQQYSDLSISGYLFDMDLSVKYEIDQSGNIVYTHVWNNPDLSGEGYTEPGSILAEFIDTTPLYKCGLLKIDIKDTVPYQENSKPKAVQNEDELLQKKQVEAILQQQANDPRFVNKMNNENGEILPVQNKQ